MTAQPTHEPDLQALTDEIRDHAVIYLRVSTMGQVNTDFDSEGFSIPAQRDACHRKAEALGAVVIEEFVDKGESARKADRPQLQRMLAYLRDHRDVRYVITFKIDRIARNREDDVAINLAIRQAGARLVSVSENIDETPSGKLLHAVMAGVAEFYSANLSHEVSKKMVEKAKKGGTLSRAPVGYFNTREFVDGREVRTIAIDPERAPHVTWAFQTYATGRYTITQLHEELQQRGLTTRAGARAGKPVGRSVVAGMLTNRYYIGKISYQGVEYDGRHEPIVDLDTFQRVQAVLATNRQGEKQREHPHYLKSTVICARCGSRLCFGRSRGRHGSYYDYFFCLSRQQKRNDCDLPYLRAEDVEAAVEDYYERLRLPADRADQLRDLVNRALAGRKAHAEAETARQERRVAKLQKQSQKLRELHYADALSLEDFKAEQQRIYRAIDDAKASLAAATVEVETVQANLDAALHDLADPKGSYLRSGRTGRKHWNIAFFENIAVDIDGVVRARLTDPYASLLTDGLIEEIEQELKNPDLHSAGRGSKELAMVAGAGFEPATFGL